MDCRAFQDTSTLSWLNVSTDTPVGGWGPGEASTVNGRYIVHTHVGHVRCQQSLFIEGLNHVGISVVMHVISLDVCVTRRTNCTIMQHLWHKSTPIQKVTFTFICQHTAWRRLHAVFFSRLFLHNIHHNTSTVLLPVTTVDTPVGVSGPEKQTAYR